MPRRRYYRRSVRVVAPKKKWASNIVQNDLEAGTDFRVLVENSVQNAQPTPVIVKAGNFKVRGDGTGSSSGAINLFILYIPESWGTTNLDLTSAIQSHPEWVMGWTTLNLNYGAGSSTEVQTFSISSRLKRNLNSGDKIVLYAQSIGATTYKVAFTAQFFTCAN